MKGTLEEQIKIEERMNEVALDKYLTSFNLKVEDGGLLDTGEGQTLLRLGFPLVEAKVKEYLNANLRSHRKNDRGYLLNIIDSPKVIAFTTLSVILGSMAKKDTSKAITRISGRIMSALGLQYGMNRVKEENPKLYSYMGREYQRASKSRKEQLIKVHLKDMIDSINATDEGSEASKVASRNVRIGTILIECVLNSGAGIVDRVKRMGTNRHAHYELKFTDEGLRVLSMAHKSILSNLLSHDPPLIVPPKDWTSNFDGGMHVHSYPIMKQRTPAGRKMLKEEELTNVYPVLNKLQATAWRVNKFVVDTIQDIMDMSIVDPRSPKKLPRLHGGLPLSNPKFTDEIIRKEDYGIVDADGNLQKEDFIRWRRDFEETQILLDGEAGRRLQITLSLLEAQQYMDYDDIYFAYNLDSRGRVYVMQTLLSPQSTGVVKAMLEFANGEYLDDDGYYWLKIHTANVYGLDKELFHERIAWIDSNLDDILAVASAPLENLSKWSYCDSPFEYLASCKAVADHLDGKPVYIGVQLDATNSGVQIYSGLLGDADGAATVNVVNTYDELDRALRADVYGIVASKVNLELLESNYPKKIEAPLSDGTVKEQSTVVEARSIAGKITRKTVKRNTMTVPYGVTKRGMSEQLWDIIKDAELNEKIWWDGDRWVVNKLLTDLNYSSIFSTIPGARMGQDYLLALADMLNEKDEGIIYHTPIYNVPVVQKKPRTSDVRVDTVLGTLLIKENIPNTVAKLSQKNGSSPNYIHSMDSTLLLRVVDTMSIRIGVIHDCFIVPPSHGKEVRDRFRESFVEIMRERPLEALSKEVDPEGLIEVPYIGTLNFDDVLEAEYIIS